MVPRQEGYALETVWVRGTAMKSKGNGHGVCLAICVFWKESGFFLARMSENDCGIF